LYRFVRESIGGLEACDFDQVGSVDTTSLHFGMYAELCVVVDRGIVEDEGFQYLFSEFVGFKLCVGSVGFEGNLWKSGGEGWASEMSWYKSLIHHAISTK